MPHEHNDNAPASICFPRKANLELDFAAYDRLDNPGKDSAVLELRQNGTMPERAQAKAYLTEIERQHEAQKAYIADTRAALTAQRDFHAHRAAATEQKIANSIRNDLQGTSVSVRPKGRCSIS